MRVLKQEEERFAETLENGMALLEAAIGKMKGKTIAGETVFKLYDTYGFPVDLTADIARERGLAIDQAGFERAMDVAARARARREQVRRRPARRPRRSMRTSAFCGYESSRARARSLAILKGGAEVDAAAAGDDVQVVLDRTPFYAESGGQVGDVGTLTDGAARFRVDRHEEARRRAPARRPGSKPAACARATSSRRRSTPRRRQATVLNHSATHLLHAALRKVLGTHVIQKGSLVAPDRLRFDFSHTQAVTPAGARNDRAHGQRGDPRATASGHIRQLPYDDAIKSGAMALFGEKYGDEVRVLSFGDFSTELCGGTHVGRTGDIGLFKITGEGGIASGIRRIEAVTGEGALEAVRAAEATLKRVAGSLRATPAELEGKVTQLLEQQKKLEREISALRSKLATGGGVADLASQAVKINGVSVLAARIEGADAESLREAADQYKSKLGEAVIVLGAQVADDKVSLVSSVSPATSKKVSAGALIGEVAKLVGGRGGGRPDFAQAGGNDPSKLDEALQAVPKLVAEKLGGT